MKKADLHIHTTSSDGRYNLDYLLEKYSQAGYDVVAITDHFAIADSISNDKVVKLKEEKYGLKIIIGMEASGEINGEKLHLLCYFNSNSDLSENLKLYLDGRRDIIKILNNKVKGIMKEKGIDIPDIDYSLLDSTGFTPILTEIVKRTGNTIQETMEMLIGYAKDITISKDKILSAKELIDEVHKSKGLIFVAHPLLYKKESVKKAIELGVDGIEAIYPSFSKEEREYLISFAEDNNILYSAGNDFHSSILGDKYHGMIGDVSLVGEPLRRFLSKLQGKPASESLEDKVARWLREEGVVVEKNTCGDYYFTSYKNKKLLTNLKDFDLNGQLFNLNNSKTEGTSILKKFNIPHIDVIRLPVDEDESYDKVVEFYIKNNNRCVIRGESGEKGLNTFIIKDISEIKQSITHITDKKIRMVLSPYYDAKHEYEVYILNGKAELTITKERDNSTGKHNLLNEDTISILNNGLVKENLERIAKDVSSIFDINFGVINILETHEGLKVVNFGIPDIKEFSNINLEYEQLSKELFLKAFLYRLKLKSC